MSREVHSKAKHLVAQQRVEGISEAERQWLEQHLAECSECAESATTIEQAIRSLRTLSVPLPKNLAGRTQMRVLLRAQQLQIAEPHWRMVWLACGLSWAFGATTAPYVWRGREWIGQLFGLPNVVWQMGFGLWWALPLVITAVVLLMTNGGRATEAEWNRQRT